MFTGSGRLCLRQPVCLTTLGRRDPIGVAAGGSHALRHAARSEPRDSPDVDRARPRGQLDAAPACPTQGLHNTVAHVDHDEWLHADGADHSAGPHAVHANRDASLDAALSNPDAAHHEARIRNHTAACIGTGQSIRKKAARIRSRKKAAHTHR